MKEKSDINKILEGRCRGQGSEYVGFKKANESHSTGTATQIYDPIADRVVDVLSMGEMYFFWMKRFEEGVVEIKEQVIMIPDIVAKVALENGLNIPKRILTTDFLVLYDDGTMKAYSIKSSRKNFDKATCSNESVWKRNLRRQLLEKRYWESLGVEWKLVFSEELNYKKAVNICSVMSCYNMNRVSTPDHMYRYLIAHKHIVVDMDDYICFAEIANAHEAEIRELYERVTKYENS